MNDPTGHDNSGKPLATVTPINDAAAPRSDPGQAQVIEDAFRAGIAAGRWPEIQYNDNLLPQMVDLGEAATLSHAGDPVLYQRGGNIVFPVRRSATTVRGVARSEGAIGVVVADVPHIREVFTQRADWLRFDKKEQKMRKIACPEIVARTYQSRSGNWRLPPLVAMIEAPTIRPDGTILQKRGYDAATGLLFDPGSQTFPTIQQEPTEEDVKAARSIYAELLGDFPFEGETDYSVALSTIFTALVRCRLRSAPLFAASAPVMASGKTLILSLVSWIVTGRPPAVVQHAKDPSEEQKLYLSVLVDGDQIVLIDNVSGTLVSDALCSILTAEAFRGRLLGKTGTVFVPTCVLFLANGNNLVIGGDLTTRTLVIRLDPKTEHPERREFSVNLDDYVKKNRGDLVAAALTIMRGFLASGVKPSEIVAPWGRFEEWSNLVRASIVWAGLPDPCKSLDRLELEDPARLEHAAVLSAWHRVFASDAVKVRQVIDACSLVNEDLKTAIVAVAGDHGSVNERRFGKWLARHENRIQLGLRFIRAGMNSGQVVWKVVGI